MAQPRELFTQNSELRPLGIYNWTLPAFVVQLTNGKHMNVCPTAGVCASVCYARNGTYNFPSVKQAHVAKLEMVLADLENWKRTIILELGRRRYRGGKWIRVHDSGDFFSEEYLRAWLEIARAVPDVTFYAYTKEVAMFKRVIELGVVVTKTTDADGNDMYAAVYTDPEGKMAQYNADHPEKARRGLIEALDQLRGDGVATWPRNFLYCYSMGGKQDGLLDKDTDRHAEIFSTFRKLWDAGYDDQEEDDRGCVLNENIKVGIIENNIPQFKKKMNGRTFGEMQDERDSKKSERAERLRLEALASDPETAHQLA